MLGAVAPAAQGLLVRKDGAIFSDKHALPLTAPFWQKAAGWPAAQANSYG